MLNNRKGVELAMNTMVIAALAILVLVILAFFVMKGFGSFDKSTGCVIQGGHCQPICNGEYPIPSVQYSCKGEAANTICCTKPGLG